MNSLINPEELGVLSVTGADAASFLQGQTTCDIYEIAEHKTQLGAFCNPKGRVIAVFVIAKTSEGFLLILPKSLLMTVQELLQRYKLRSKVEFSEMEDLPVARFLNNTNVRTPWILPETTEQFIPQMLKLDESGAVSFKKGCYTGQEIVTRTHYLGEVKRQLNLALCEPSAGNVQPTLAIFNEEGEDVGTVLLAQVRGLPYKVKDEITGEIVETKTVNKMVVLCVINSEAISSTLRLGNATQDNLKIVGGGK